MESLVHKLARALARQNTHQPKLSVGILKAHVRGYQRKDGTLVREHEDSRPDVSPKYEALRNFALTVRPSWMRSMDDYDQEDYDDDDVPNHDLQEWDDAATDAFGLPFDGDYASQQKNATQALAKHGIRSQQDIDELVNKGAFDHKELPHVNYEQFLNAAQSGKARLSEPADKMSSSDLRRWGDMAVEHAQHLHRHNVHNSSASSLRHFAHLQGLHPSVVEHILHHRFDEFPDDGSHHERLEGMTKLQDLVNSFKPILKAKGEPRPNHKYTARHPDGQGGWKYEYGGASHDTPHEAHRHTGENANANFTHAEMSLPEKSAQPHGDLSQLIQDAAHHKSWQDDILRGLAQKHGWHVVEGRMFNHDDIAQGHQKGGLVLLADLKGSNDGGERMREKVADNYGGDASRLKDISRASVAVPHPQDMAHVTHALREAGIKYAQRPEDRFESPTAEGYSDIATNTVAPNGHIGELQIHSLDMLGAKEHGVPDRAGGRSGHKLYELARKIGKGGVAVFAPHHQRALDLLGAHSKALYAHAKTQMMQRDRTFKSLNYRENFMNQSGKTKEQIVNESLEKAMVRAHYRRPGHHGIAPAKPSRPMNKEHTSHPAHSAANLKIVGEKAPAGAPALPPVHKWDSPRAQEMLRPGYFSHHGFLAAIQEPGAHPVAWYPHQKEWRHVPDVAEFFHDARRKTVSHARELMKLENAPFLPEVRGATSEDLLEHLDEKRAAHAQWWRENYGDKQPKS